MLGCFYLGSWILFKTRSVDFIVTRHQAFVEQRRQTPASYALDTLLNFAGNEASAINKYQIQGWSHPEPWGTWTDGAEVELAMRLTPVPSGPLRMTVRILSVMTYRQQPQGVEILANDLLIGRWSLQASDSPSDRVIIIPVTALNGDRILRLVFRIRHPVSPRTLGENNDPRQLGIGISQIQISAVATENP